MFEWWEVLPDSERRQWALDPFVSVGPLRFGMSPDDVSKSLNGFTPVPQKFTVQDRDCRWRGEHRELGLVMYYGAEERLRGVVVDALRGPQVFADERPLVSRAPSELEQWLRDRAARREPYSELSYLAAGIPGSQTLGVVVSVQRAGDRLITRPVFLPTEAMEDVPHFLPAEVWDIH
ncbi:MAG: hypothetical protein HOV68_20390 [Streptomycetaceae bacterium]|nr:hypothetical protein [Streptomycetaceae bacterium]